MKTRFVLWAAAYAAAVLALPAVGQTPLGTGFIYQGHLREADAPVNDTADFQFRLFTAVAGGTQVGTTQTKAGVRVVNGLFQVELDFGASAFDGNNRWLEVLVRSPAGSGSYTTLTPRQPMNAAPYALFALGTPGGVSDGHSLDATDGSPADAVFVNNTGNVGVGTTTPERLLDIRGNIVSQLASGNHTNYEMKKVGAISPTNVSFALSHRSNGTEAWMYGYNGTTFRNFQAWDYASNQVRFPSSGNTLLVDLTVGKVGVGTSAPVGGLHINIEPLTSGGTLTLEGTTHSYVALFPRGMARGRMAWLGFGGAGTNELSIWNEAGGNINLVAPGAATRVGVLEIAGADLAEKFPVSEKIEPGMVVAIDPEHPGELCLARGAYNQRVAGVVSGANGFTAGAILGNLPGHEDSPPIALSGRVYVQCDASNGAIVPGDMLTTSDTPGYAMKTTDRERTHGAVIGKAMTGLSFGDKGLVLVLVNLQ